MLIPKNAKNLFVTEYYIIYRRIGVIQKFSVKNKFGLFLDVLKYRPRLILLLTFLSILTAFLEGVGLSFIYPVVEFTQTGSGGEGMIMSVFKSVYNYLGVPISLGNLMIGASLIMAMRYSSSFILGWLSGYLSKDYETYMMDEAFNASLSSSTDFFDKNSSDEILNHIITESRYSGKALTKGIEILSTLFLITVYTAVMLLVSPQLTLLAITILGTVTLLMRFVLEPAISIGSKVAVSNEEVQRRVQEGTQGVRDVKLYQLEDKIYREFKASLSQYKRSSIKLARNESGMKNLYKMSAAISIFLIIFVGFTYTELGLGQLGIFLVSMFQLAPRVSRINGKIYKIEGYLPHVKRLQKFIESAGESEEDINGSEINSIEDIEFNDVSFSYTSDEEALDKINFKLSIGDLIALVGHSGAGKSTIASLIPRMYEPSSGNILSGGKDIRKYGLSEWREKIAVVRQNPYIFDKTLEENIKICRPNVSRREFEEACETAQVKEFSDDLPDGIDSDIGEDGVKLSGGQRQRVAIARALLKDPDILVLDEATSDLDSELERKIYKAVKSKGDKFGVIAITHRLSTVRDADRIYTMKNGEIVETGEHQELIDLEGNYFKLHRGEK